MRIFLLLTLALLGADCASAPPPRPAFPVAGEAHGDFDPDLLRGAGVDPSGIACNRDNRWGATLKTDSERGADDVLAAFGERLAPASDEEKAALHKRVAHLLFWRMVRAVLLEGDTNNFGVFALKGRSYTDERGVTRPVLVFRSGVTPRPGAPGSCFASLLEAGHVRHVVNLFDGEIPVADLVAAESAAAARAGASYRTASDDPAAYGPWRELVRSHYDEPEARRRAMEGVARLIEDQILAPAGGPPKGNIHIHCGGGMHRSGMVAGVIERCFNGEPLSTVEEHYRYHVGWRDAAHPGGYEENNVRFLRDFDCALLREALPHRAAPPVTP